MSAITRTTPRDEWPEMLRVPEVATLADCSEGAVYEAIRSGTLPCVRFGRLVRVPRAAIVRLLGESDDAEGEIEGQSEPNGGAHLKGAAGLRTV